jgi:tetratricopeptide (TPR) repeat protein
MRNRVLAVLLGLASGVSYAPMSLAQPSSDEAPPAGGHDDQAARWLFNSARDAFEAGDYEAALDRFEQSFQLSNRPALLYNIGTTLDRLRRDADALAAFERYLELVPDSPNRGEIEARVLVLQGAVNREQAEEAERARMEAERQAAEQARLAAERDAAAARAASEESQGIPSWAFWTVAGAGAGTLVTGTIFHGLTANRNGVYEDYVTAHMNDAPSNHAENLRISRGLYEDALKMRNVTIGMYAATAVLGIGAGVMIPFTDWGDDESLGDGEGGTATPNGEAGLRLGPGSLSLGLTHRF